MEFCKNCGIRMDAITVTIPEGHVYEQQPHHAQGCPSRWHEDHEQTGIVRLNEYQAANLLWLLREAVKPEEFGGPNYLNTGDWNYEIIHQLEETMRLKGGDFLTFKPNAQQEDWEV